MRVIVAGTRTVRNYHLVRDAIESSPWGTWLECDGGTLIHGGAPGVDTLAGKWAEAFDHIQVEVVPADWEALGRRAGPIRNAIMASDAEALIAIWDGRSRGTLDMITKATQHGVYTYIHPIGDER